MKLIYKILEVMYNAIYSPVFKWSLLIVAVTYCLMTCSGVKKSDSKQTTKKEFYYCTTFKK